jgi:hypothetical protein
MSVQQLPIHGPINQPSSCVSINATYRRGSELRRCCFMCSEFVGVCTYIAGTGVGMALSFNSSVGAPFSHPPAALLKLLLNNFWVGQILETIVHPRHDKIGNLSLLADHQYELLNSLLLLHLLTYLLTPWCRLLFEKLIVTQLVESILLSYGNRRFITVFTKARHWTLS